MAIDRSQFITRSPLEDFSLRFYNEQTDFIADEVLPPFPVPRQQFKVYQYDLSNLKPVETQKDSKAEADKVDYGLFTSDRAAQLHKLAGEIDPRDERDADPAVADIREDTAASITEKLTLSKEMRAVTLVSTAGNYPAGLTSTLAGGSTWMDAGGDPERDAKVARIAVRAACGKVPNALALSWTAYQHLINNPALKDRLKYTSGQSITEEQLKNLLGVQFLHVAKAIKNTAAEGAADALTDVWGDFALFYVKDSSQSRRTMQYGRTFMVNQWYTHEYQDDKRGSGAGRIKVLEMGMEYVLGPAAVESKTSSKFVAGYLLQNVY